MYTYFDINKLKIRLKEFFTITRIRITVFDAEFKEISGYPDNRSELCNYIRSRELGNEACIKCDLQACQMAAKKREPHIYKCHAGLTEIISPLYIGDIIIGYLFFAHIFSYNDREIGTDVIISNCVNYGLNPKKLETLIKTMPLIHNDYISAAAHLLQAVATQLCMERIAYLKHEDLPLRIEKYINNNLSNKLTTEVICEEFAIGKTALCKISKEIFGESLALHIRNRRIDKASELLRESQMSIAQIADNCGFDDYSYFIALFKKKVGLSPLKYRKMCAEHS